MDQRDSRGLLVFGGSDPGALVLADALDLSVFTAASVGADASAGEVELAAVGRRHDGLGVLEALLELVGLGVVLPGPVAQEVLRCRSRSVRWHLTSPS